MGFLVEKAFQGGRALIQKTLPDIQIESLASIASLDDGKVTFQSP